MTNQNNNSGFSIEQIYSLVGRYDYTASVTLRKGSKEENLYETNIVGVFLFSKSERECLELRIANMDREQYGIMRFCCFLLDIPDDRIIKMENQDKKEAIIIPLSVPIEKGFIQVTRYQDR